MYKTKILLTLRGVQFSILAEAKHCAKPGLKICLPESRRACVGNPLTLVWANVGTKGVFSRRESNISPRSALGVG